MSLFGSFGSMNISQSLFQSDEKVAAESGNTLSAFINQSKISTYYQDNPYKVLAFSDKFGVPTSGGPITEQGSGHKPGNIFKGSQVSEYNLQNLNGKKNNSVQIVDVKGIIVPKNMSNF